MKCWLVIAPTITIIHLEDDVYVLTVLPWVRYNKARHRSREGNQRVTHSSLGRI